jgi:uncharacterized membrane protein HdeD (DUF308 family)
MRDGEFGKENVRATPKSSTRDTVSSSVSSAARDTLQMLRRWSWVPIVQGHASVLFGVACFTMMSSALAVLVWVWIIGFYALFYGVLLVILGVRLRNLAPAGA